MNNIEKELDKLIQMWATKQRSYISSCPAECGHHYYSRRVKLLRWDLKNIIPLTYNEHSLVHSGHLRIDIQNPFRKIYLEQMFLKDFKSYLLENNLTENEWLHKKYQELKNEVDNNK